MVKGHRVLSILVTGDHSLAKRITYSHAYRAAWVKLQKAHSETDLYFVFNLLGYSEIRWQSKCSTLTRICMKLGLLVRMLVNVSLDNTPCHRDEQTWATNVVRFLTGRSGFIQLCMFGVDADHYMLHYTLVALGDKKHDNVAVSASDLARILEMSEALFYEGRIFQCSDNNTYTYELLMSVKDHCDLFFGKNASVAGSVGWPSDMSDAMAGVKEHCQQLHAVTIQVYNAWFPDNSWRHKLGCFGCGEQAFPKATRVRYIREIAKKRRT